MTTMPASQPTEINRPTETPAPAPAPPTARRRRPWLRLLLLLVVPFAGAGAVYAVSSGIAPTYSSAVTLLVGAPGTGAISDQSVSASNDLASQYAQLGDSDPVLRSAERRLKMTPGGLSGKVNAGTVAAQNIIRISAEAGNRGEAVRRANAVSSAFTDYILRLNRRQADQYNDEVNERLEPLDQEIARARKALRSEKSAARRNDDALVYSNLVSQRQQVAASLAQDVVASQARVQPISGALGASKTSPKPDLYAIIAFGALALICLRLGWMLVRPSRA